MLLSVPFVIILRRDGKKEAHCFEKNAEIVTITNSVVLAQSHYTKQKKTAVRGRQAFCTVLAAVDFIPSPQALSSFRPLEKTYNSSPLYTSDNQM